MAIQAALSLGCGINQVSIFSRKNYFYPDLPKGYQISQYALPLAERGKLGILTSEIESGKLKFVEFRVHRVHLEDDAGKSIHRNDGSSYVDLNRTGVPLIEIVTEPDLRTPQQAQDFLTSVHRLLRCLGVCDGNMEQGSLRCDANVSLRRTGTLELGTKTEIKNLNSFRFLRKALEFEIERQKQILGKGGLIEQETRLWNEEKQRTILMRSKEFAHDYRYFPDPDLLPLRISDVWLSNLKSSLPVLPEEKQRYFIETYGFVPEEALQLTQNRHISEFFEATVEVGGSPKVVKNWILGELVRLLKRDFNTDLSKTLLTPVGLASLIQLVEKGTVGNRIAKKVLEIISRTGQDPVDVVSEHGLREISNQEELFKIVNSVVNDHPKKTKSYRLGKTGLLGFFMGQVMKETRGQANPKIVNDLLKKVLSDK